MVRIFIFFLWVIIFLVATCDHFLFSFNCATQRRFWLHLLTSGSEKQQIDLLLAFSKLNKTYSQSLFYVTCSSYLSFLEILPPDSFEVVENFPVSRAVCRDSDATSSSTRERETIKSFDLLAMDVITSHSDTWLTHVQLHIARAPGSAEKSLACASTWDSSMSGCRLVFAFVFVEL